MTNAEERRELMQIATEVQQSLKSFTTRIHMVINKLIGEADALKIAAADEVSAGTSVTRKTIVYNRKEIVDMPVSPEAVKEAARMAAAPSLGPGKRACSLCREVGHRATNCPNAHKVQAEKKAEVAARPEPKAKRVMSPERKAQLIATLAKARAAKKGGKK